MRSAISWKTSCGGRCRNPAQRVHQERDELHHDAASPRRRRSASRCACDMPLSISSTGSPGSGRSGTRSRHRHHHAGGVREALEQEHDHDGLSARLKNETAPVDAGAVNLTSSW
jgi:hypothetical protein